MINFFSPAIYRHGVSVKNKNLTSYTWTISDLPCFDELLISWNALRPLQGQYVILVSVRCSNGWSPWLLYAVWGTNEQYSFHESSSQSPVRTFQDQVELLEGEKSTGFRIRVEACKGASLENFFTLFACVSTLNAPKVNEPPPCNSISLPVTGISQLCLPHPRAASLCSPTSTTAVIRSHSHVKSLNPLDFARNVYDSAFDIYGHWPFNVAQAFSEMGHQWQCYCARLAGFETIMLTLAQGWPVVVSLKGPLSGSLKPYTNGHLIVVHGYDSHSERVLCMDPAFPTHEGTAVSYPLSDFLPAWSKRHHLAYMIRKRDSC